MATLSALTYRQIAYWRDSETLWSYALRVTGVRSYKAHFNLAVTYDAEGRYDEAVQQFREATDPRDDDPRIHLGLGIYDQRHGHAREAIAEFQAVLRLSSDDALGADALNDLGSAYQQIHDYAHAKESFAAALRLNPNKAAAMVGMGLLSQKNGDFEQAIGQYSRAMSIEPTAVGYVLLARALQQAGHPGQAQAAIDKARQLTNDFDQAQKSADDLLTF
jgi:tetratricopeptide (TPR) repeat protein